MSFGYGEAICPDCYKGEKNFLFFDKGYWLNRIISHLFTTETSPTVTVLNRIQTRNS